MARPDSTVALMCKLWFLCEDYKLNKIENARPRPDYVHLLNNIYIDSNEQRPIIVTIQHFINKMIDRSILIYNKRNLYVDKDLLFQTIYNYSLVAKYLIQLMYMEAAEISIPYESVIKTQRPSVKTTNMKVSIRKKLKELIVV